MRHSAALLDDDVDDDCELEDKKERGSVEFLNVEGDGILDSMYEVLWTKQDGGSHNVADVIIPDTVVFKFNKPTGWYFTKVSSKTKAARLHKKKPSALRVGLILDHFEKRSAVANASDIVAYFITQVEASEDERHRSSTIYYLSKGELSHWLLMRKNKNGILQAFVDPKPPPEPPVLRKKKDGGAKKRWVDPPPEVVAKARNTKTKTASFVNPEAVRDTSAHGRVREGDQQRQPTPSGNHALHNCLVRCTWNKSVCLVERRTNVHSLSNTKKASRYDRAETFEGDFRNSTEHPLTSAKLLEHTQTVCSKIVQHFWNIGCGKVAIANMVINFKFDKDTRLHLLWCESLRLDVKKHHITNLPLAPPPAQIGGCVQGFSLANKLKLPCKSEQGQEFRNCPFCKKEFSIADMVKVKYLTLLATYDEIKMTGGGRSEVIRSLKQKWFQHPEEEKSANRDPTVPLDEKSFTIPMNPNKGLLAHLDPQLEKKDPMAALAKAIEEWDERTARNGATEEQGQKKAQGASGGDAPGGIPWFVKQLHPYITIKDWHHVRDRDDFLNLRTCLCAFCFLGLSHGFASEDSLKRHQLNIQKKPRIESLDELPLGITQRPRHVGVDDRRVRAQGRSRLVVPCRVTLGGEGVPLIEKMWCPEGGEAEPRLVGQGPVRPHMFDHMTGRPNGVEEIDVSSVGSSVAGGRAQQAPVAVGLPGVVPGPGEEEGEGGVCGRGSAPQRVGSGSGVAQAGSDRAVALRPGTRHASRNAVSMKAAVGQASLEGSLEGSTVNQGEMDESTPGMVQVGLSPAGMWPPSMACSDGEPSSPHIAVDRAPTPGAAEEPYAAAAVFPQASFSTCLGDTRAPAMSEATAATTPLSQDPMGQYRNMIHQENALHGSFGLPSDIPSEEAEELRNLEVDEMDAELMRRMQAITGSPLVRAGRDSASGDVAGSLVSVSEGPLRTSGSTGSLGSEGPVQGSPVAAAAPSSVVMPLRSYIRNLNLSPERIHALETFRLKTGLISEHDTVRALLCRGSLSERLQLAADYRALCDRYGVGYLVIDDMLGALCARSALWGPDVTARDDSLVVFYNHAATAAASKDPSEVPRLVISILACLCMHRPVEATTAGVTLVCDCHGLSAFAVPSLVSLLEDVSTKIPVRLAKVYIVNSSVWASYALWAYADAPLRAILGFLKESQLKDVVDEECLPVSLGGRLTIEARRLARWMQEYLTHQWRPHH